MAASLLFYLLHIHFTTRKKKKWFHNIFIKSIYATYDLGWDMGRKRLPSSKRREVISISLKPSTIDTIDHHLQHDQSRSKWIEHIILKHLKATQKPKTTEPVVKESFSAYCNDCDILYSNPQSFMMERHYCTKCYNVCEYLGLDRGVE